MKIAITGHTAGIGRAFAKYLSLRDHEIVGISKSTGLNIRNIPKTVDQILPCDMWINNAQSGYAQVELLYQVMKVWNGDRSKMIWNISTMLTQQSALPEISGMSAMSLMEYKNQKQALEKAHHELKSRGVRMCLIRPGAVATQSYNQAGVNAADVDQWTAAVCDLYIHARQNLLWPEELSLGFKTEAPDI